MKYFNPKANLRSFKEWKAHAEKPHLAAVARLERELARGPQKEQARIDAELARGMAATVKGEYAGRCYAARKGGVIKGGITFTSYSACRVIGTANSLNTGRR
jgi:hypothetical protein